MTAREILDEMEDRLKQMIDSYKSLEAARIDMLAHFKHLATEAIERVDRARALAKDFDPDKHLALARREAKRVFNASMHDQPTHIPEPVLKPREREVILEERSPAVEPQPKKVQKSFFDEIG